MRFGPDDGPVEAASRPTQPSTFTNFFNDGESRYHAIGFANARLMAVVVYVDRSDENEEIIHIISARKAEAIEEKIYAAQF